MDDFHFDFGRCPRCDRTYDQKDRKKTKHHIIPKFMKPKKNITMSLCLFCHNELNESYVHTKKKIKIPKVKEIKVFKNRLEGLQGPVGALKRKIDKLIESLSKEGEKQDKLNER